MVQQVRDDLGLRRRGLLYEKHDINVMRMFPGESFKHFIAKAALFYGLRKQQRASPQHQYRRGRGLMMTCLSN